MINPFKSKKGLGRGLSSLIGDSKTKVLKNKISVSSLIRNKYQPRKKFNKDSLDELTSSIKERGIIQPIVVRKSEHENDKYEIIAGERRWLAAQNAGLHEVPIVEVEADDLKSLEFAIVENVQRNDLNPIEEANGYQKLIDEFSYDQDKVAKFIGKSRAHITNCIRLLSLPTEVIKLIEEQSINIEPWSIQGFTLSDGIEYDFGSKREFVEFVNDHGLVNRPAIKEFRKFFDLYRRREYRGVIFFTFEKSELMKKKIESQRNDPQYTQEEYHGKKQLFFETSFLKLENDWQENSTQIYLKLEVYLVLTI